SFGSLSRIENGQTNPTKETLMKISKCLHLREDEIAYLFHIRDLEISEADIQNIIDVSNEMFKDIQVPAYVYDYRWRIWNWNDQLLQFFNVSIDFVEANRGISIMDLILDETLGIKKQFPPKYYDDFICRQVTKFRNAIFLYRNEPWAIELLEKLKKYPEITKYWDNDRMIIDKEVFGSSYMYLYINEKEVLVHISQSVFYSDPRFYLVEYYPIR
ncbi:MAG: helix-turn-helix domain-containing protein, partial [Candidatus Pacearchaeota archaeon]